METDILQVLESLKTEKPTSKDDVRQILLARKRETLIKSYDRLKKIENKAIKLIKKVDYSNIKPRLIWASPKDRNLWVYFRMTVSSAPWQNRPGRALFGFVIDDNSGGVLAFFDLGSDLQNLSPRDKYIGWTHDEKWSGGLNRSINLGTCVSVSPFGSLTGGKYIVMALLGGFLAPVWHKRYGDYAAAIVTTSLYGKSSIYNRIEGFKYVGDTPGFGVSNIDGVAWSKIRRFREKNNIPTRTTASDAYNSKMDTLQKVCAFIGYDIEKLKSHQPRGVYVGFLCDDAINVLKGKNKEYKPIIKNQDEIRDYWLSRWYSMRYPKISNEINQFNPNIYRIDNQIDLCGGGEAVNAPDSTRENGGSNPTPPLSQ